ncbi:hypothetical protein L1887_07631 [Cichorium endivia]|nr:hypothetical protein L1887_07631 [Cichorium endivia]
MFDDHCNTTPPPSSRSVTAGITIDVVPSPSGYEVPLYHYQESFLSHMRRNVRPRAYPERPGELACQIARFTDRKQEQKEA